MNKVLLGMGLVLISTSTLAMFCPKGFNNMNIGDTVEQVTQSCGPPDSIQSSKAIQSENKPQEWNYYIKANPTQPGTFKMSIAFDTNQTVINISVNGTSVVSTPICGSNIEYGSTTEMVKRACGKPSFINGPPQNQTSDTDSTSQIETTIFTYNTTPAIKLIFVNGKLKERK